MLSTEQKIKEEVRERYTRAITTESGCCKSSCCGAEPESVLPPDRLVASAGYSESELRSIPQDAASNSFGCGNPLAFAGVKPGHVVVDIGSGAGIDCFLAAQKVGPTGRVIGIDMTTAMLEKARANALKAGVANVEFRQGEAESMPITDGTADWIISNCVINLSPDKPAVFREAFRVLKSGGRVSVSDIMVEELPLVLRQSTALYTSCVAGAIPEAQYLNGLRKAGFVDVEVTERIVYDRDQLVHLAGENLFHTADSPVTKPEFIKLVEDYVVGKVWSAKVTARKP
jgi:SAM-dependent methyltransferase